MACKQELNKNTYMKKLIITVTFFISGLGFLYYHQPPKEVSVSKNIDVEVYKTSSYVSPVYAKSTAQLEVTVVRIKNNRKDTVWQHSFQPTELKDFPESDNPLLQKITIPNVNDRKEKLEVYYKVTYDSKGSILNYWNITTIGQGQQTGKLHIQI
jgi:hypothetical protein